MSFRAEKVVSFEHTTVVMGLGATYDLGTLEEGRRFYPMELIVIVTEAPTGSGQSNLSLGTNAPDYDNIVASLNINGVGSGIEKFYLSDLATHGGWTGSVNSGAPVKAKVTKTSTLAAGVAHVVLDGFYYP